MNALASRIVDFKKQLPPHVTLVAVSKTFPATDIAQALESGHVIYGENRVQELMEKQAILPQSIQWHQIGTLQRNKVKYIAPFISLIHSADSLDLLNEINKQAHKNKRTIPCLLQVHIASEESKKGFDQSELRNLSMEQITALNHISIQGLMGMASNTSNQSLVKEEFTGLKKLFDELKSKWNLPEFNTLSMGMSSDYKLAIACGSNMIRIGSTLFGNR